MNLFLIFVHSLYRKFLLQGLLVSLARMFCKRLLSRGDEVVGLDNINSYYDVNLSMDVWVL